MTSVNNEISTIIKNDNPAVLNPGLGLRGTPYIGGKLSKKRNRTNKPCKHVYLKNGTKCVRCEYRKLFRKKTRKNRKTRKH